MADVQGDRPEAARHDDVDRLADLTRDAEDLLQEVAPQVLCGPGAFSSPDAA